MAGIKKVMPLHLAHFPIFKHERKSEPQGCDLLYCLALSPSTKLLFSDFVTSTGVLHSSPCLSGQGIPAVLVILATPFPCLLLRTDNFKLVCPTL